MVKGFNFEIKTQIEGAFSFSFCLCVYVCVCALFLFLFVCFLEESKFLQHRSQIRENTVLLPPDYGIEGKFSHTREDGENKMT